MSDGLEQLEPCPFCGGEGRLSQFVAQFDQGAYFIECNKCRAQGPTADPPYAQAERRARRLWNERNAGLIDAGLRSTVDPTTQHRPDLPDTDASDLDPPALKGDYVFATKYADGDPGDMWALGFYDHGKNGRHWVKDGDGNQIRGNGFRKVRRIRGDVGRWLLSSGVASLLEQCPPGTVNLWAMLTEKAFDLAEER